MIALNRDMQHAARDAALEQTQTWSFIRVTRTIPVCPVCQRAMVRYSGGPGRTRYYKCMTTDCKQTGTGQTSREYL